MESLELKPAGLKVPGKTWLHTLKEMANTLFSLFLAARIDLGKPKSWWSGYSAVTTGALLSRRIFLPFAIIISSYCRHICLEASAFIFKNNYRLVKITLSIRIIICQVYSSYCNVTA